MAKYVDAGNSVECSKSNIALRKITTASALVKVDGINYFKYKTKKRAIVTVTEELRPKVHRICPTSYLNLNDILEADTVEIYVEKRITLALTSNFSHVHGIQANNINMFTYAKIIIPWRFIAERAIGAGQPI